MTSRFFGKGKFVPPQSPWAQTRLDVNDLRMADFRRTRRGFDPLAVHQYLDLVADEVARLRAQLVAARAETDQIKRGLRQWQSDHAASCYRPEPAVASPPRRLK